MNAAELAGLKDAAEHARHAADKFAEEYQHRGSAHDQVAERHERIYHEEARKWHNSAQERYLAAQAPLIRFGYAVASAVTWPVRSPSR